VTRTPDHDLALENAPDGFHARLHQIKPEQLSGRTAQTKGMKRLEAICHDTVGSERLWMGQTHVSPDTKSANHHHGHSETGIFVIKGSPVFVFLEGDVETRLETQPGDYVFVPPWVPHREENPDPNEEAVVVIARSTQEAIVVNVETLQWTPAPTETLDGSWHTY
jgi:uncharacterized RmlC-like cupin family protein